MQFILSEEEMKSLDAKATTAISCFNDVVYLFKKGDLTEDKLSKTLEHYGFEIAKEKTKEEINK